MHPPAAPVAAAAHCTSAQRLPGLSTFAVIELAVTLGLQRHGAGMGAAPAALPVLAALAARRGCRNQEGRVLWVSSPPPAPAAGLGSSDGYSAGNRSRRSWPSAPTQRCGPPARFPRPSSESSRRARRMVLAWPVALSLSRAPAPIESTVAVLVSRSWAAPAALPVVSWSGCHRQWVSDPHCLREHRHQRSPRGHEYVSQPAS